MFAVPLVESTEVPGSFTVPHDIIGEFGAGRVLIKPALPGTGVMAGSAVRAVLELAGVTDVITKELGTNNALNVVKATAEGLRDMETAAQVADRRGVSVDHIFGRKETK